MTGLLWGLLGFYIGVCFGFILCALMVASRGSEMDEIIKEEEQ